VEKLESLLGLATPLYQDILSAIEVRLLAQHEAYVLKKSFSLAGIHILISTRNNALIPPASHVQYLCDLTTVPHPHKCEDGQF